MVDALDFLGRSSDEPVGGKVMALPTSFELATDAVFRLVAGFAEPPRPGRIAEVTANGQVRIEMDDVDGGEVLAWPLNGFEYEPGAVVFVMLAANSPSSGIVVGSLAPTPTLPGQVIDASRVPLANGGGYGVTSVSLTNTGAWIDVLPAATVTAVLHLRAALAPSSGAADTATVTLLAGGGASSLYSAGGNTVEAEVTGGGVFRVQRAAGSATFAVALDMLWV
jgi:hypothetical protein